MKKSERRGARFGALFSIFLNLRAPLDASTDTSQHMAFPRCRRSCILLVEQKEDATRTMTDGASETVRPKNLWRRTTTPRLFLAFALFACVLNLTNSIVRLTKRRANDRTGVFEEIPPSSMGRSSNLTRSMVRTNRYTKVAKRGKTVLALHRKSFLKQHARH